MSEQKVNSGILKLLEFRRKADDSAKDPEKGDKVFKVMINPDSISRSMSLLKTKEGKHPFKCSTETISFTFYLDGTNVVPQTPDQKIQSIDKMLEDFLNVVYRIVTFNVDNPIKPVEIIYIEYGGLNWKVRTNSITIEHTLFDRLGNTLRAKVTCSFETIEDESTGKKENVKSNTSKPSAKDDTSCNCAQKCDEARKNNQDSLYYTPADANFSTLEGTEIKV